MRKPERAVSPIPAPATPARKGTRPLFGGAAAQMPLHVPENDVRPEVLARPDYITYALWALAAVLCLQRCLYHLAFLNHDPFALVPIADAQPYENAARDILAHPYWGSRPFFLQGSYAYLLAAGMALNESLSAGLIVQLCVAGLGLSLFGLAAHRCFGSRVGLASLCVLLASPGLAFFENKYGSTVLGSFACMFVLWAFARNLKQPNFLHACLLGVSAGLAGLCQPELFVIIPFCAVAAWWVAQRRSAPIRALFAASVIAVALLTLVPMALRNLVVTGSPTVLPSHAGGVPFYIGTHPEANGRWNDADGLFSRQVHKRELAARLGVTAESRGLDAAIGGELYRRGFAYIRSQPWDYAGLELQKFWALLGNHAFTHDYDPAGEAELLGEGYSLGLPFGLVLGLGALGLALLARRAIASRHEREHAALCCVLFGLVLAVLAANLFWYTEAAARAALYVPLAFAAGPALDTLVRRARRELPASALPKALWIGAAVLCVQAFLPRVIVSQPSASHYFNVATAQEELGRTDAALDNYALATERNPNQPNYWWRRAMLAKRMNRLDEARASLDQLIEIPSLPPDLKQATRLVRQTLR